MLHPGSMKIKELRAFLKKYALDSPVKEPTASKKSDPAAPEVEAEDSEDAKEKAVPQVSLTAANSDLRLPQVSSLNLQKHCMTLSHQYLRWQGPEELSLN